MLIAAAFLTLFSAWALWGWAVGESRNIKPLRKTCGPIFVIAVTVLVGGVTIRATESMVRQHAEQDIRKLLTGIHDRLQQGQVDVVQQQLTSLIGEDPDQDPIDLMASLPEATSVLRVQKPQTQIATVVPEFDDHRRQ